MFSTFHKLVWATLFGILTLDNTAISPALAQGQASKPCVDCQMRSPAFGPRVDLPALSVLERERRELASEEKTKALANHIVLHCMEQDQEGVLSSQESDPTSPRARAYLTTCLYPVTDANTLKTSVNRVLESRFEILAIESLEERVSFLEAILQ